MLCFARELRWPRKGFRCDAHQVGLVASKIGDAQQSLKLYHEIFSLP
jgi:hypothetical protein